MVADTSTVRYRARVLPITLAKMAQPGKPTRYVFVGFFKTEAWLCQNYHTDLQFYVGGNNLPNISFVSTMVIEKLEWEDLKSGEGNSVWENWAGEGTSNQWRGYFADVARVIRL